MKYTSRTSNLLIAGQIFVVNRQRQSAKYNRLFLQVDFQQSVWNSPAIDILTFLSTSLAEDVDVHHREDLLVEYLNTLTKTMSRLCCETKPPTMEALEKSLKDYEIYAVMSSCLFLPVVRLEKKEVVDLNEMIATDDFSNPTYKGEAYRKIMLRRLPVWIASGLLDN